MSHHARQAYAEAQPWYRDSLTEGQARQAGIIDEWPAPCERCGALYRRTPAGRWLIDHFPEGHTEPRLERQLRVER